MRPAGRHRALSGPTGPGAERAAGRGPPCDVGRRHPSLSRRGGDGRCPRGPGQGPHGEVARGWASADPTSGVPSPGLPAAAGGTRARSSAAKRDRRQSGHPGPHRRPANGIPGLVSAARAWIGVAYRRDGTTSAGVDDIHLAPRDLSRGLRARAAGRNRSTGCSVSRRSRSTKLDRRACCAPETSCSKSPSPYRPREVMVYLGADSVVVSTPVEGVVVKARASEAVRQVLSGGPAPEPPRPRALTSRPWGRRRPTFVATRGRAEPIRRRGQPPPASRLAA